MYHAVGIQASTAQTPTVGLKYGRSECSRFNCTVLYSLLKPRLRQFRSRRLCNHLPVFLDQHARAHQPLRDLVGVSEVAHSGRVSVHQRAIATESRVVLCENLACPGRAADRTTGDDAPFVRDAPGEQHVAAVVCGKRRVIFSLAFAQETRRRCNLGDEDHLPPRRAQTEARSYIRLY